MESTETSRRQEICGCYDAIKSANNGKCVDNNLIEITKFITPPEPPPETTGCCGFAAGDVTVENNKLDRSLKKFKDISLSSNSDTTETSEMNEEDGGAMDDDVQKQETNNCFSSDSGSSSRKNSDDTVPIIVIPDQCKPNIPCDHPPANNPSPSSPRLIHTNKPSSTTNHTNSFSNRFLEQHIKIIPKTQSLDLVDENSDGSEGSGRSSSHLQGEFRGRMLPKTQTLEQSRPIYPNVPYSPYNSPYGSPRSGRRRVPLKESRRISIEKSGSFVQLNQYKLMDQIGQVRYLN